MWIVTVRERKVVQGKGCLGSPWLDLAPFFFKVGGPRKTDLSLCPIIKPLSLAPLPFYVQVAQRVRGAYLGRSRLA